MKRPETTVVFRAGRRALADTLTANHVVLQELVLTSALRTALGTFSLRSNASMVRMLCRRLVDLSLGTYKL